MFFWILLVVINLFYVHIAKLTQLNLTYSRLSHHLALPGAPYFYLVVENMSRWKYVCRKNVGCQLCFDIGAGITIFLTKEDAKAV